MLKNVVISASRPESFTVSFDLGSSWRRSDSPPKFLELRFLDHSGLKNIFTHPRGNFLYLINPETVSNIGVLDDFLYGCNYRYKVYGKFTQYLEDCNRANPSLKILYNELAFRYKDPIALNFIKSQKRLSVNYLAKK